MSVKIKVYSKKELAQMYGVSLTTLMVWVKPVINKSKLRKNNRFNYFTPKEVNEIFQLLGCPEN